MTQLFYQPSTEKKPPVFKRKRFGLCWRCGAKRVAGSKALCLQHLLYERQQKRAHGKGVRGVGRPVLAGTEIGMNTEEKLRRIVCEQFQCDEREVTRSASFTDDLDGDSLDQVELVMSIEEAFDLEITDIEADKLTNFGALLDYVSAKTKLIVK